MPSYDGAGMAETSCSTSKDRGGGWEELPRVQSRAAKKPPCVRGRGSGWEEPPATEARGGSWEKQPQVQGAVAAQAQEDLEELSDIEGQEGQQ